jgi:hypothetical protein
MPYKKHPLTEEEQELNKEVAVSLIEVEHFNAKFNKF